MKREQLSFLAAGVILGFTAGFVVAWGISQASPPPPVMPSPRAPAPSGQASSGGGEAAMGEVQERIARLKKQIAADDKDPAPLIELADLYMQVAMYPQAKDYLAKAVAMAPEDTHARTHLGIALGQTGDLAGAREQFEAVVAASPDDWQGWFYLAVTTVRMGDTARAREATARVEALNPTLPELQELKQALAGGATEPRGDG